MGPLAAVSVDGVETLSPRPFELKEGLSSLLASGLPIDFGYGPSIGEREREVHNEDLI